MVIWIYVSLLVAVVGAFVYALASAQKPAMLGLVAFGCGLLAFLMQIAGTHAVRL
jgi:hypothetical protein